VSGGFQNASYLPQVVKKTILFCHGIKYGGKSSRMLLAKPIRAVCQTSYSTFEVIYHAGKGVD
jgi:hypothetical protein